MNQATERKHKVKFIIFYILTLTILFIVSVTPPPSSPVDLITTLVIPLALGISGWVAFFYQYYSEQPKIKGKILQVMKSITTNPMQPTEQLASFILFLYLTNVRKNAVHLRDYKLEVDIGNGFESLKMLRGIRGDTPVHFLYAKGGEVQIPDFNKGLIYKQEKPVEYGVPFYGYLAFAGDIKYNTQEIKCYRLTLTDVFDKKHTISAKPEEFRDLFYLQEVFKIKIPQ